jgi:hypothetical protein
MSNLHSETIQESNSQPALPLEGSEFNLCSCATCGKRMAFRDARDYGLPDETPRQIMRVVWWECSCGHREVVARDILP